MIYYVLILWFSNFDPLDLSCVRGGLPFFAWRQGAVSRSLRHQNPWHKHHHLIFGNGGSWVIFKKIFALFFLKKIVCVFCTHQFFQNPHGWKKLLFIGCGSKDLKYLNSNLQFQRLSGTFWGTLRKIITPQSGIFGPPSSLKHCHHRFCSCVLVRWFVTFVQNGCGSISSSFSPPEPRTSQSARAKLKFPVAQLAELKLAVQHAAC